MLVSDYTQFFVSLGTVARLCTKNGVWEVPDYRNCVRVELQTVNEQVLKHLQDKDKIR